MAHDLLGKGGMIEIALEKFPVRAVLNDGSPCSIRPMEKQDEIAFSEFHSVIPDREQLFIKNRIKDGSLFREWISDSTYGEHLPLTAFVDGRLVATGSLHQRMGGWKRHIGKVYFLTHPEHRGLGLIDVLLEEIIEVARHCGLTKLESEINGERASAIESMAAVGFRELVRLPDYICDMRGLPHDYVLMGMDLVASFENLGAGD
ncbi:MAG: GNAT family N-acetyltransferase [Verrucomicrobiae bacterium]|nr:GNAT family N-acetyltransferase [Verrucomicrobiae bacterium]